MCRKYPDYCKTRTPEEGLGCSSSRDPAKRRIGHGTKSQEKSRENPALEEEEEDFNSKVKRMRRSEIPREGLKPDMFPGKSVFVFDHAARRGQQNADEAWESFILNEAQKITAE